MPIGCNQFSELVDMRDLRFLLLTFPANKVEEYGSIIWDLHSKIKVVVHWWRGGETAVTIYSPQDKLVRISIESDR